MVRFLLYLFPALIDLLLGSFFFISTVRIAESGASALAVSTVFTLWGICYMTACFLIGRMVTTGNCRQLMVAGCIGISACAAAFIAVPSLGAIYAVMAVFGIAVAFFFPPYIFYMKQVESGGNRHIASSTAIYTMAWSLGLAAGPFVAGAVWSRWGWQWVCALDIALGLLTLAGLFLLFRFVAARPVAAVTQGAMDANGARQAPDLAWLAWIGSGVCMLAMAMVRAVFPADAHALGIPKPDQGITLALVCVAQALVAIALVNGRSWLYRAGWVMMFGLVGIAGLILFGLAKNPLLFHCAALCIGVYTGSSFIYMTFHALVHPSKAGRNVGINESIVGLTGILGPALAGLLADHAGMSVPFFTAAGLVFLALAFQVAVHLRLRYQPSR